MHKKLIVLSFLSLLMLILLAGCASNPQIPKTELQQEALAAIQKKFAYDQYNSITLMKEEYDSKAKSYNMYYQVDYRESRMLWNLCTLKVSSRYNSESASWRRVSLSTESNSYYPSSDLQGITFSDEQGRTSWHIVSIDKKTSSMVIQISLDNAESWNHQYTVSLENQQITCMPVSLDRRDSHLCIFSAPLGTIDGIYAAIEFECIYNIDRSYFDVVSRIRLSGQGKQPSTIGGGSVKFDD